MVIEPPIFQALGQAMGIKCQKENQWPVVAMVRVDRSKNDTGMEFQ